MDDDARQRQLRRAVIASAVGTAIEWYDFFLYGVAASLVFPKVFFPPGESDFKKALASYSTFFVGFASRPLGAAIFGHYGDRIGRKASLIATLLLMGAATMAIGLVPGYASVGLWGAVLLTVGRTLQGIGVGGEWGGSVLLAAEWGDRKRRGYIASWPQFGAPAGLVLANGALAVMNGLVGEEAFLAWGWRVPFLLSFVLVGIGFYIRVGILETPTFAKLKAEGRVERMPVLEVLRLHGKEVALTALLRTGQQTPFYIFSTFVLTYGTQALHLERAVLLKAVLVSAVLSMVAIPLWGHLSDRVGRRRLVAVGCVVMIAWIFPYYQLLDTRAFWPVFLAIALAQPLHDIQYGPQAAVIAESFPSRLRYSGSSLGYQLASITSGGPAPLIALALFERFHSSMAIAAYVAACAVVSLVALALLPDRSHQDLEAH
jgi:metabolite-proton symporter